MGKRVYKEHYDNTELLNTLDRNGNKPTFYIVCSAERGPGKTFSFSRTLYEHFEETGEKFILLTRNIGDLGNVASGVLNSYLQYALPEVSVSESVQMKGAFSKVYFTSGSGNETVKKHGAYVIPLNSCEKIKLISSHFYDAWAFFFDEFQPMSGHGYLKDELGLLYTIYKSVARGEGSAIRYMPVFMCSNTITLGNPYFEGFGLNKAIQSNTKFYRGEGVVFENCEVEGLAEAHKASPIDTAMKTYLAKRGDNIWLNDNNSLVAKPDKWGRGRYVCTLIYNNNRLGVYSYDMVGLRFISRKVDSSCQYVYNLTLDGELNIPLLRTTPFLDTLKKEFFRGMVRVNDNSLQNMLMDIFG